jgi:Methylenetetrahydrofolate reductase
MKLHLTKLPAYLLQKFGIDQGTAMCKRILESGNVHGLHMYTLNMERSAVAILENLGLINDQVCWQCAGLESDHVIVRAIITAESCLVRRCHAHCHGGRPRMCTGRRRVCGRFIGAAVACAYTRLFAWVWV